MNEIIMNEIINKTDFELGHIQIQPHPEKINTNIVDIDNDKNKIYNYNKKIELVNKINKIKKKEYLMDIFKIILVYTKDYTENINGVFVFFHNLCDEAYEKIETYVNNIYKLHSKKIKSIFLSDAEFSETSILNSDIIEINGNRDKDLNKDLTNREKLIIKRKKYEQYLSQNQDI